MTTPGFGLSPIPNWLRNARSKPVCNSVRYGIVTHRIPITSKRSSGKARERKRGDGRRPSRIGELIYRELTPIIEDAFALAFEGESDTAPVVVTVEGVTCSSDLRTARVRIDIMGNDEQKKQVRKWLKETRKSLRFELAQCIHMKYVPELQFGESEEPSAQRTMNIIEQLAEERKMKQVPVMANIGEELEEFDEVGAILDDDEDDTIGPSYTMNDLVDVDDDELNIVDIPGDDDDDETDDELTSLVYRKLSESV